MKILAVITSYGTANDEYLHRLVDEYRSMSFDIDLVVLSNLRRRVADGVEVITVPRRRYPWTRHGTFSGKRSLRLLKKEYRDWVRHLDLPFAHRQIFADRRNDYDLFLYSEDDTLVTEENLRAFLAAAAVLPANEIPGFLRFERGRDGTLNYPEVHGHFHWEVSSVRKRGGHTFAFFTNEHAACYVVTRDQLRRAIDSGGFLVDPHGGKYDLLCTAGTDIYTQCGMQKLLCISELDEFLIHHLPNKYVGTTFGVDDAELRRQVDRLLRIGTDGKQCAPLLETETKLPDREYSKGYYEPVRPELMSELPSGARTVLSIGSGWGAVECCLAAKGLRVSAVPLDAVIPGAAEADGVEIIDGGFEQARRALAGRQFDCLLLSNVLHLVPNPVEFLSSLASLLSPGGVAVAVVPNTSRLEPNLRAVRGVCFDDPEMYRTSGVQHTSRETVRSWFGSAGFRVQKLKQILPPGIQKIGRLAKGMMDTWLAYEFIVAGRKPLEAKAGRSTELLHEAGLQA
jgi:2-polyprenyl-3-methyl-5-hydroxy-6-metoxy-1,4-benzoquinol methylase